MRINTQINVIGILGIIFGTFGTIEGLIQAFAMPGMLTNGLPGTPPIPADTLKWMARVGYVSLFSNALYLLAGIVFLLKKDYSVRLMYVALLFSLLKGIFSGLVFRLISMPISEGVRLDFIGPLIDVILLIAVFRLRKYYLNPPPEQLVRTKSVYLSPRYLKIWTLAGILCLLVPLSVILLWHHISGFEMPREAKVELFKSYFPGFLRGRWATSYMSGGFSILTIIFSGLGLGLDGIWWRILNLIVLILGSLFFLWFLFTLL